METSVFMGAVPSGITRPGKSAQAVGQMAKAAVAAVKEQLGPEATLPKNVQGMAASHIAKGGEVSALMAALVPPAVEETPLPDGEGSVPGDNAPLPPIDDSAGSDDDMTADPGSQAPTDSIDVTVSTFSFAIEGYSAAISATGMSGGETALELLK